MVDRYNTGDQRPSNSMKNLSDNALAFDDFVNSDGDNAVDRFGKEFPTISKLIKNVDEIFSSQLSMQESTFSESQTDKENRFQQFLNTSGYVFLGDYQDGPFQFSARNQYIRYDNEYYRLNAATDVGFTTTGTDATSFANDVTHFVLMDGDTLRQNLGSGEGLLYIGSVPTIAHLSMISPAVAGQRIQVTEFAYGYIVGGGKFIVQHAADFIADGGKIIASGNTGLVFVREEYYASRIVRPEWYGCRGRGATIPDTIPFANMLAALNDGDYIKLRANSIYYNDFPNNSQTLDGWVIAADNITLDGGGAT
ncbi:TPA: hypothetical protein ACHV8U_004684, partial [Klebsiella quasipneumoniae]